MKTIEDRAKEYVSQLAPDWVGKAAGDQFEAIHIAGAESEHTHLTRWNDPDESRPENLQRVLVKYKKADGSTKVGIATFHNPFGIGRGSFVMEASRPQYIIGWREIHE